MESRGRSLIVIIIITATTTTLNRTNEHVAFVARPSARLRVTAAAINRRPPPPPPVKSLWPTEGNVGRIFRDFFCIPTRGVAAAVAAAAAAVGQGGNEAVGRSASACVRAERTAGVMG